MTQRNLRTPKGAREPLAPHLWHRFAACRAPGSRGAQDQPQGLLSVALGVEACSPRGVWSLSANRAGSLGRWPTETRPPASQGCSLGTTAPSGRTQETAAPPWPPGLRKSQIRQCSAAVRPSELRPFAGYVSLEQLKPLALNDTQDSVKGLA